MQPAGPPPAHIPKHLVMLSPLQQEFEGTAELEEESTIPSSQPITSHARHISMADARSGKVLRKKTRRTGESGSGSGFLCLLSGGSKNLEERGGSFERLAEGLGPEVEREREKGKEKEGGKEREVDNGKVSRKKLSKRKTSM